MNRNFLNFNLFIVLLFVLLSLTSNLYAGEKLPVMLKVRSNFDLDISVLNTLRSGAEEILTERGYLLISKEQQEEALKEQVEQQKSDCYDDACLVEMGKMLAAQKVLFIDINEVKSEYFFKAKFVDLETGSIERTILKVYKGKMSNVSKLLGFSKNLTNETLGIEKRVFYLIPYAFTDVTMAKDIKYISLGIGVKFIKLKIGDNSIIEINGKLYMNATDKYYYTDFEALYKYNVLNKLFLGLSIPFRMMFETDGFDRGTGILPSLFVNYNLLNKHGLFLDMDLHGGVALSFNDDVERKLFMKTGINFGYQF